jgi:hypothetical protein
MLGHPAQVATVRLMSRMDISTRNIAGKLGIHAKAASLDGSLFLNCHRVGHQIAHIMPEITLHTNTAQYD